MAPRHNNLHYNLAGEESQLGDEFIRGSRAMAPRDSYASPIPWQGPVKDFGTILNISAAATPFDHGLQGVNQSLNSALANALIASLVFLLVMTIAYRCAQMLHSYHRRLFSMEREDQRFWMHNHHPFWARMKKHLIYAPLFRQRHNKQLQLGKKDIGAIPSRYHAILILLYVVSNFAYCLVLDYGEDRYAVMAELRGRTGFLAAVNIVAIFLFGLRDLPLMEWIAVSYDTFNLMHRYCGRVVFLETLVHTACWASSTAAAGGSKQVRVSLATSASFSWAMIATCTISVMIILSLNPLRHAAYEVFLNLHRGLALVFMVGVYLHLEKANLPNLGYIQTGFILWVASLAYRFVKLAHRNYDRQNGCTKVTVEAMPAEACKVTFELSRPWHWRPGCHVHAYLPAFALWSSHPFSVAWAENRPRDQPLEIEMPEMRTRQASSATAMSRTSRAVTVSEKTHQPESANIALPRDANCTSVTLIMRAQGGMTKKLYNKAKQAPNGKFTTWGLLEGPYGGHEDMSSYGTAILFAGGIGITHCIGYVRHLLLQYQAGISSTKKILLIWSITNNDQLIWIQPFMDQILQMEGRKDILRLQIFITKPRNPREISSSSGSVHMFPGRCNPQTIIQKEMQERIGAVGVTVCGPGALSDTVRSAVREVVEDGYIDYVEEAFTY